MKTTESGINLIKSHESLVLEAYFDPVNVPTIGYGHTSTVSSRDVFEGKSISENEATTLLMSDLSVAESCVNEKVKVPLNSNQFDSLVSFVFNVGVGAFSSSTLLKKLNSSNYEKVPFEMSRWVYATDLRTGKKITLNGLVRRRLDEGNLFSKPDNISEISPSQINGSIQTISPSIDTTPKPSPVREERQSIMDSRTIKAGAIGVTAGGLSGVGKITKGFTDFTNNLSQKVTWFDDAVAVMIVGGVVISLISIIVMMWCRWDDFKSSKK